LLNFLDLCALRSKYELTKTVFGKMVAVAIEMKHARRRRVDVIKHVVATRRK
jgi:hypothetical protein